MAIRDGASRSCGVAVDRNGEPSLHGARSGAGICSNVMAAGAARDSRWLRQFYWVQVVMWKNGCGFPQPHAAPRGGLHCDI